MKASQPKESPKSGDAEALRRSRSFHRCPKCMSPLCEHMGLACRHGFATSQESSESPPSSTDRLGLKASNSASTASGAEGEDDIVHFAWKQGMELNARYEVLDLLGDGTFGRVVLAHDRNSQQKVAVKVIRDIERYTQSAKAEAEILLALREADPRRSIYFAAMHETFTYESHFCLVFEALGTSLHEVLLRNDNRGFWVQDVRDIAQQCLSAVQFLHEEIHLVHTDLKPENILLESMGAPVAAHFPRSGFCSSADLTQNYFRPCSTRIKIIDFGSARFEQQCGVAIINTQEYRSPEVILEMGWTERSDIWSLGCVLMELYTGDPLFSAEDSLEHLALMERVLGAFPREMLGRARTRATYLCPSPWAGQWRLNWPEGASSDESRRFVQSSRPLPMLVMEEHVVLAQLVARMLSLEPAQRPTASAALEHNFFLTAFSD